MLAKLLWRTISIFQAIVFLWEVWKVFMRFNASIRAKLTCRYRPARCDLFDSAPNGSQTDRHIFGITPHIGSLRPSVSLLSLSTPAIIISLLVVRWRAAFIANFTPAKPAASGSLWSRCWKLNARTLFLVWVLWGRKRTSHSNKNIKTHRDSFCPGAGGGL